MNKEPIDAPDAGELKSLQCEVERLLGRNLLRLQQYETLVKAVIAHHKISGPPHALEELRTSRIDATARKTLGTLVNELLGSFVVSSDTDVADAELSDLPDNVAWVDARVRTALPHADFVLLEAHVKELVLLRNDLVHHFIDQHDLTTVNGSLKARDALVEARSRIDRHIAELREWAEDAQKVRQAISDFLKSGFLEELVANRRASEEPVNEQAVSLLNALGEAFDAIAVNGWARVEEADKWITTQYPDHKPAKYGFKSWRQVLHECREFELRYRESEGKRAACFRKFGALSN